MLIKVKVLKAHDIYRRGAVYERELDVATASLIVNGYLQRVSLDPPGAVSPSMEDWEQSGQVAQLVAAVVVEDAAKLEADGSKKLANPRRSRARNPLRAEPGGDQLDPDAAVRDELG